VSGTLDTTEVCNKGDLFLVLSPEALGLTGVVGRVTSYLDEVRASPTAPGVDRIDVPGDRARRTRAERRTDGIPLEDVVWAAAEELLR
jgi:LDH2 family malate/lactate/ureidoglycolate dehydrogenase